MAPTLGHLFKICVISVILSGLVNGVNGYHKVGNVTVISSNDAGSIKDGTKFLTIPLDLMGAIPQFVETDGVLMSLTQSITKQSDGTCIVNSADINSAMVGTTKLPVMIMIPATNDSTTNISCSLAEKISAIANIRSEVGEKSIIILVVFTDTELQENSVDGGIASFREVQILNFDKTLDLPIVGVVNPDILKAWDGTKVHLLTYGTFGRLFGELLEGTAVGILFSITLFLLDIVNMVMAGTKLLDFVEQDGWKIFTKLSQSCLILQLISGVLRIPFCLDPVGMHGLLPLAITNSANTAHLVPYMAGTFLISFYWNEQLVSTSYRSSRLRKFKWPAISVIAFLTVFEIGRGIQWALTGPLDILFVLNSLFYTILMLTTSIYFFVTGKRLLNAINAKVSRISKLLIANGVLMIVFVICAMLLPFSRNKSTFYIYVLEWYLIGLTTFFATTCQTMVFVRVTDVPSDDVEKSETLKGVSDTRVGGMSYDLSSDEELSSGNSSSNHVSSTDQELERDTKSSNSEDDDVTSSDNGNIKSYDEKEFNEKNNESGSDDSKSYSITSFSK